jgi:hypothetical protein
MTMERQMAKAALKHDGRSSNHGVIGPGNPFYVHGESHKTPEHSSWQAMIARCQNSKHVAYHRYGGRGIAVCPQWLGSEGYRQFLADMGRRPSLSHTLDRRDPNGNYEPANCRWATKVEQQSNQRSCVYVEIDGERVTVSEAGRRLGIGANTLRYRLAKGWPMDEVLTARKLSGREIGLRAAAARWGGSTNA